MIDRRVCLHRQVYMPPIIFFHLVSVTTSDISRRVDNYLDWLGPLIVVIFTFTLVIITRDDYQFRPREEYVITG